MFGRRTSGLIVGAVCIAAGFFFALHSSRKEEVLVLPDSPESPAAITETQSKAAADLHHDGRAPLKSEDPSQAQVAETQQASKDQPVDMTEPEPDPTRRRWRKLRFLLQEYRKIADKKPLGSQENSLCGLNVGAILIASGRGMTPQPGRTGTATTHYMVNNGLAYEWPVGEFPEYDAMRDYALAKANYDDARWRRANPTAAEPTFDPSNFILIEARAEEAIALLESRYGFSTHPK